MRDEYNFENAVKNPYIERMKKQITINIDASTIDYFKGLAESSGIPYQTLINSYLAECVRERRRPTLVWK